MGFRFRKSFKIAPGVRVNIGKKSTGISIGGKGGGVSFNSKTGMRARASVPGTGISYSTKIGGGKKSSGKQSETLGKESAPVCTPSFKKPIPHHVWYIVLAVLFVVSGIIYCATKVSTGLLTAAIGGIMLFFTFKTSKENEVPQIDMFQFDRQRQIFEESIKLFMETTNIETFFGRYEEAEQAALFMSNMTDAPILHDEPPQAALDMLEKDKTDATNAFLERYAKEVRTKAYELTRGRKAKMESFKLITSEYEDKMTPESIAYRDKLYTEMLAKVEA